MALVRIQDLAPAAALTGTEEIEIEQGGVSVRTTVADVATGSSNRSVVTAITPVAGVATIDYAAGDYFTLAPTANVTSMVFDNLPSGSAAITLTLMLTQDTTARTVAWPAEFTWAGGTPGAVSTGSGAVDLVIMTSFDQGVTFLANIANAYS